MNIRIGDYLIIWSLLTIVKVQTIRTTGSITRYWVEQKDHVFPIETMADSSQFIIRRGLPQDDHPSTVSRLSGVLFWTFIALLLAVGYFAL